MAARLRGEALDVAFVSPLQLLSAQRVQAGEKSAQKKAIQIMSESRIGNVNLRSKIMSADEAAALIPDGVNVGMSGFTGAGYPKLVPLALAARMRAKHAAGEHFKIGVWTGASTAPELDGALAKADGIELRLPYQSDPVCRKRINDGELQYIDIHLSHVAQFVWFGFLGKLDVAVVEVAGVLEDGRLVPSSSVGNNKTWLDQADKIILEVNSWQNLGLEGTHDIYYGTDLPPRRRAIRSFQPRTASASPISSATPKRSSPSSKPMSLTATRPSPRLTPLRAPSPGISSNSLGTRCRRAGCRATCCRCNRA
jgi:Acetyl-CoA hydrolase/transferase N-terminal domain